MLRTVVVDYRFMFSRHTYIKSPSPFLCDSPARVEENRRRV